MADGKKISLQFDFNAKDVEFVTDRVLTLTEKIKILKKELQKGNLSQEQFEILSSKLNETKDQFAATEARSRELFGTLQLIPGPIGDIASKIDGTISLLKTFGSFKLSDIKAQLTALVGDVGGLVKQFANATGITKVYTILNNALAASFVKVGVGEAAAAAGARAFSAALVATGVGALVVGLGLAVNALMEFASGSDEAKQKQDELANSIERVNNLLNMDMADASRRQKLRLAEMKRDGATEAEIRKQSFDDLQENLKLTNQALEENYALERKTLKEGTGNLADVYKQQEQLEEKRDQLINDLRVASVENDIANNKEREQQREKDLANQKTNADKEKQLQTQILNDRKSALDASIELEISSATTSQEKLEALYKKRNQLDLNELDTAEKNAKTLRDQKKITGDQYNQIVAGIEAKRQLIADKTKKSIEGALKDDKDKDDERIKNTEDFNRKIRDLQTEAIVDEVERSKTARTNKYNDELAALEKDKEFIAKSETEKAEIRKNLKLVYDREIETITDNQKKKDLDKERADIDARLRLLELQGQGLLQGTRAYYENRAAILDETEISEKQKLKQDLDEKKITQEDYEKSLTATTAKYGQLRKQLKQDELAAIGKTISATFDALGGLTSALASSYDEEAKTSEAAFNKRKKLQIATAVMSAASGLVQILTQPSTLPSPFDWIVKGINAAALAVATGVNISKIKKTTFEAPESGEGGGETPYKVTANRASGGIVTGPGTATSDSINARLSNGEYVVNARATSAFLPLLNTINGMGNQPRFANGGLYTADNSGNFMSEKLTEAITQSMTERPIKTYVVGTDMSNQQQFDRTLKSRSLI